MRGLKWISGDYLHARCTRRTADAGHSITSARFAFMQSFISGWHTHICIQIYYKHNQIGPNHKAREEGGLDRGWLKTIIGLSYHWSALHRCIRSQCCVTVIPCAAVRAMMVFSDHEEGGRPRCAIYGTGGLPPTRRYLKLPTIPRASFSQVPKCQPRYKLLLGTLVPSIPSYWKVSTPFYS